MKVRTKLLLGGSAAVAIAGGMYIDGGGGDHPYGYELATQIDHTLHGGFFNGFHLREKSLPQPVTAAVLDTVVAQMERNIEYGHNPHNDVLGYCGIAAANGLLEGAGTADSPLVQKIHTDAKGYSFELAGANQAPPTLAADCRDLDLKLSGNVFAKYPYAAE